jgi:hypothetical protein
VPTRRCRLGRCAEDVDDTAEGIRAVARLAQNANDHQRLDVDALGEVEAHWHQLVAVDGQQIAIEAALGPERLSYR